MAELIHDGLADPVRYDRVVQRAEWLREAGQGAAGLSLLEELEAAADAGEIEVFRQDLEQRLAVARALQQ
jgi:hypothetical protein